MPRPQDAASLFDRLNTPLMRLLDRVPADRWGDPSPCEGWSAMDVVEHLVTTQRDFLLMRGVDLPQPAPRVADGPALAWRHHSEAVARQLADSSVAEAAYDGAMGPSTIGDTMVRFYGFDLLVHRWDVARATGGDESFTDEELDTIETALDGFGEHLYADGICRPAVELPEGASRRDQLLARTGRDPR